MTPTTQAGSQCKNCRHLGGGRYCKLKSRPGKRWLTVNNVKNDCKKWKMNAKCAKELAEMMMKMHEGGLETGAEIVELVRPKHPKALAFVPLYRSAMVIEQNKKHGDARITLYHDPEWMGRDCNAESVERFKEVLHVYGQRSGPDLILDRRPSVGDCPGRVTDLRFDAYANAFSDLRIILYRNPKKKLTEKDLDDVLRAAIEKEDKRLGRIK